MRSLGNLRDLKLYIFSMTHEDVDILGSISTLLFLKLETLYGANGRIFIRGFRSLKYFSLRIFYCGTCLEFEARSMPKLDHLKLEFCGHDACNFGIQHLSTLTKIEVIITKGDLHSADTVGTLVTTAIETLPNHPTLSFVYQQSPAQCVHFGKFVESVSHLSLIFSLVVLLFGLCFMCFSGISNSTSRTKKRMMKKRNKEVLPTGSA
jgi:hypothetical protein